MSTGKGLTNPAQALLTRAAASPRQTGESERLRARYRASGAQVILCDVSQSMAEPAGPAGAKPRIDHLREALAQVAQPQHVLLAFASSVTPMRGVADLPAPSGGTALELALAAAAQHDPAATLVISDGQPTVPARALEIAERLPGRIDVLFCGDERDAEAIAFMRALARAGSGRVVVHRWATQDRISIAGTMRLLLAAPGR